MTSNDDLMGFLLKMEDKRARERDADRQEMKELREKERKEDKEEIVKVIDNCLGEKVMEAIEPFKEKTIAVEQAQLEMKEQVNVLIQEMSVLKDKFSGGSEAVGNVIVTMASVVANSVNVENAASIQQQSQVQPQSVNQNQESEYNRLVSLSRRTMGLHRIDAKDLVRMRQVQYGGARTEEEEKLFAAREYLRLELKIDSDTLNKMQIERVFAPARADPQCLYVTFKYVSSVSRIFERTRNMRKESRILPYFPTKFFSRFEAVSDIGKVLREEESCQTRIKMGLRDIQLFKRDKAGGKWVLVPLKYEELPPVDLTSSPRRTDSGSPAPGRPCQGRGDKRGRESTGSSTDQLTPKIARKEAEPDRETVDSHVEVGGNNNDEELGIKKRKDTLERMNADREEAWRKELENAELVGESEVITGSGCLQVQPDLGTVMSVTGTPAKPTFQSQMNQILSPIIPSNRKSSNKSS